MAAAGALALAASVLFTVHDPRIVEASGLAPGVASPGVVYVQNDSGDTNRFFALDARSGATAAVVTVPGARNVDWEDLATGPGAGGRPAVWIADIGDNAADRSEVDVYRVPEPHVDPSSRGRAVTTARPDVWRLRYPSGPTDAESLAVAPDGRAYLVTKRSSGTSIVYRLPAAPSAARVQTLRAVATVRLGTPGQSLFGLPGRLATGAAMSADGSEFVIRTYTDAYVWRVHGGDVAGALRARPVRVPLPGQQQGEGVAVVGSSLEIDSEGRDQPVWSVPLPGAPAPSPAGSSPISSPSTSSGPSTSSSPTSSPAASSPSTTSGPSAGEFAALGAVAAVLLVGVGAAGARRRARRGG